MYIAANKVPRNNLLYWHHDVPWCGQIGVNRSVQRVSREFYWPKMSEDIEAKRAPVVSH